MPKQFRELSWWSAESLPAPSTSRIRFRVTRPGPDQTATGTSRISRTFRARASGLKGFPMKAVPSPIARFDYSVIGDNVNVASRLEGQSKTYDVGTVVGESTTARAPDFAFLELDLLKVKGKTEATRIFALLGDDALKQIAAASSILPSVTREFLDRLPSQGLGRRQNSSPRMRADEHRAASTISMRSTASASPSFGTTLPRPIGTARPRPFEIAHATARPDRPRRGRRPHVQACGRRFLSADAISILEQGKLRPSRRLRAHAGIHVALTPLVYLVLLPGFASARRRHRARRVRAPLPYRLAEGAGRPTATAGRRKTAASGTRSAPISSCTG